MAPNKVTILPNEPPDFLLSALSPGDLFYYKNGNRAGSGQAYIKTYVDGVPYTVSLKTGEAYKQDGSAAVILIDAIRLDSQ